MHEWLLLGMLVVLGVLAITAAVVPLRHAKIIVFMVAPVLVLGLALAYWVWGSWPSWHAFVVAEAKQKQAEKLVRSLGSTKTLIERFKAHLKQAPDDAKGWFLLGRVYVAEADWVQAHDAFRKAHDLDLKHVEFTLHYVQSVWELNHQAFDESSRKLLLNILERNPEQPDALAMLALDAYSNQQYASAVMYWERLLALAPQASDEADKLRQAIAKARMQMAKPKPKAN